MSKIEQTLADLVRQTTEMESRLQALAGRVIALEPRSTTNASESPEVVSENYWLHEVTTLLIHSPTSGDREAALETSLPACAGCDFSRLVMRNQKPHFSCVKLGMPIPSPSTVCFMRKSTSAWSRRLAVAIECAEDHIRLPPRGCSYHFGRLVIDYLLAGEE